MRGQIRFVSVWESSWKWEICRSEELILWVGNNANCHSVMVIEDTNIKLSCPKPVDCILIFSVQKVYKKHRKAVQRLVLNPCGTSEKQLHLGSSMADVGQSLCQTWNQCCALQFTSSMTRMERTKKYCFESLVTPVKKKGYLLQTKNILPVLEVLTS